jgi:predicted nucleotidyltransferase
VQYGLGLSANSLAMGDLDGDRDLDLAVADSVDSMVSVLLNEGDGTFSTRIPYATGFMPQSVATGDLDGDADLDLAVANFTSHTVSVLLNSGDGTFATQVPHGAGIDCRSVAIGDLDGDRDLDLAVTNSHPVRSTVSVLLNRSRRKPRPVDPLQDPRVIDAQTERAGW